MKHTPGPWTFGVYETTETFRAIEKHSCVCDQKTMMVIAVCGPAEDRQSQIDAELIATAPDLLDTCYDVAEWLRLACGNTPENPKFVNEYHRMADQLEMVIAKAKGGK